tara:strand:- start:4797 stop:5432 length:636 start_codon:yes stop_codon:yes gene_type:complete
MSNSKDHKILEALLFASNEPVDEKTMIEKIKDKSNIDQLLIDLKNFYNDRGINLIKTGNNWSFRTSQDLKNDLIIFKEQKRKISRAAIEVLSIIAYHQPITRAEIENIRGVQMGRGSIDILMEIGWIKPKGRKKSPGRPVTWVTTENFLDNFSLGNISDLPGIDELKASGFLDKRTAISTISEFTNDKIDNDEDVINQDEDNLEDFISQNN